jgi:hypothetical protein
MKAMDTKNITNQEPNTEVWVKTQCGFTGRLSQLRKTRSKVMEVFRMSWEDLLEGFVPYTAGTDHIISWEFVMPSGVVYTLLNDE